MSLSLGDITQGFDYDSVGQEKLWIRGIGISVLNPMTNQNTTPGTDTFINEIWHNLSGDRADEKAIKIYQMGMASGTSVIFDAMRIMTD